MPTPQQVIDEIATATVDIVQGRMHRWQDGDKRGEFHRVDHLADAADKWKKIEDIEEEESQDIGVSHVCP